MKNSSSAREADFPGERRPSPGSRHFYWIWVVAWIAVAFLLAWLNPFASDTADEVLWARWLAFIVPVLIGLIGGYAILRAGKPRRG